MSVITKLAVIVAVLGLSACGNTPPAADTTNDTPASAGGSNMCVEGTPADECDDAIGRPTR